MISFLFQESESIFILPAQLFVFCVQSSAEFLHAAVVLMITKTTQAGPPTRNKEIYKLYVYEYPRMQHVGISRNTETMMIYTIVTHTIFALKGINTLEVSNRKLCMYRIGYDPSA